MIRLQGGLVVGCLFGGLEVGLLGCLVVRRLGSWLLWFFVDWVVGWLRGWLVKPTNILQEAWRFLIMF